MLLEDSILFRSGVSRLLHDGGMSVVAELDTVNDLLHRMAVDRPDVVVADIRLPPTHTTEGLEAALRVRAEHEGVGVLVLSQHLETEYAVELLEDARGGVGYLLKDRVTDPADLLGAIERVAAGGTVVDPEVVSRLLGRRRRESPLDELTRREREVLAAMAEGRSNQAIADALFASVKTIETHIRSIFQKLDLHPGSDDHRRVLAVLSWLRER